jgi:hypothetical protein
MKHLRRYPQMQNFMGTATHTSNRMSFPQRRALALGGHVARCGTRGGRADGPPSHARHLLNRLLRLARPAFHQAVLDEILEERVSSSRKREQIGPKASST